MQRGCDLYFCSPAEHDAVRPLAVLDRHFKYEAGKIFQGYAGVTVRRLKLVPIVADLRLRRVACFSVPVEYRDRPNLDRQKAFRLAQDHARTVGAKALSGNRPKVSAPLFWLFDMTFEAPLEEKAGALVMVDRLDGHIWTDDEYEEYMYDYNNIF